MYNKSEIMKRAWKDYRTYRGMLTFGQCLKSSWKTAKRESSEKKNGIVRISYREYKTAFSGYRTVSNSYDKSTKTIEVYMNNSGLVNTDEGFYYNGKFAG